MGTGGRESLGGRLGSTETCYRDVDDDDCRAGAEVEVRRTGMHVLSLIAFLFIQHLFAFPLVFFLFVPFLVFFQTLEMREVLVSERLRVR